MTGPDPRADFEQFSVAEGTVTIINKLGLHARAASRLVSVTKGFAAEVELAPVGGDWIDAKSIMAVMMLAAAQGTELQVRTFGAEDAQAAYDALKALIDDKMGEPE